LGKQVRRHRAAIVAALCLLVAVILGVAGVFYHTNRLRRDAEQALGRELEAKHQLEYQKDAAEQALRKEQFARTELAQERQRVDQERDRAQTVLDLLISVFEMPDPLRGQGQTVTARQVLDLSAEKVVQDLEAQPEAQAALMDALGSVYKNLGMYKQAEPLLARALEIRLDQFGAEHLDVATSRVNLGELFLLLTVYERCQTELESALRIRRRELGEEHADTAVCLHLLGRTLYETARYPEAEQFLAKALDVREKLLGKDHPDTAATLNVMGMLYYQRDDHQRALHYLKRASEARKNSLGMNHPDTASSLSNLATVYDAMAEYLQAAPLYRQAIEIQGRVLGEDHPDYATTLNRLARLYYHVGDYAQAEPLMTKAHELRQKTLGDSHPGMAESLNNLATLYQAMGDNELVEQHYRQALKIKTNVMGADHPETAESLVSLGAFYYSTGEFAQARTHYQQALDIFEATLGPAHSSTANALYRLAQLYHTSGELAQAEELYRRALQVDKDRLGEKHPNYARDLYAVAEIYVALDKFDLAKQHYRECFEIRADVLGEAHAESIHAGYALVLLYYAMGDSQQAVSMIRESTERARRFVELTAGVQSERQQRETMRNFQRFVSAYLTLAAAGMAPPDEAYQQLLSWKGVVFARQRQLKRAANSPELAPITQELQSVAAKLANLSFAAPEDPNAFDAWKQHMQGLAREREQLERTLAREISASVNDERFARLTAAQLQAVLPPEVAFVDFLEYHHVDPPTDENRAWNEQQRLVAFVIRKNEPIRSIDLGPVEPIADAVGRWRTSFGGSPEAKTAAAELRNTVWQPLDPLVRQCETIIISPDGPMRQFSMAALPGETPDSYLIEKHAIARAVSATVLYDSLTGTNETAEQTPSLLLVGDVDYGADGELPAHGTLHRGLKATPERPHFRPLPGTRDEVLSIRQMYEQRFGSGQGVLLTGVNATEDAFRSQARRHTVLHLATAGFFASPVVMQSIAPGSPEANFKFDPTMYSVLALAGANQKSATGANDGLLTAAEAAMLDLSHVDMVVLSACETALGSPIGDEELGLRRSFQVAGARTVIASLWSVDDKGTMELMQRFYENLWQRKMSKLEALRQAQLWLYHEGGQRGLQPLGEERAKLAPYYFAPFVLYGDWR
jgi:CHAT domain-containing protein/Tfp pilus assembly protein PilF